MRFVALSTSFSKYQQRQRQLGWIFVTCFGLLLIESTLLGTWLRTFLTLTVQPIQRVTTVVIAEAIQPFTSLQDSVSAQRRVQLLSAQYADAVAQLEELDQVRAENELLRSMLQATSTARNQRIIAAPVTGFTRPAIAVGSQQGVQPASLVFVNQVLIGTVTEVEEFQAEVQLLHHESTQPILARTASGVEGLLRGDGRRLVLTEVPITQSLPIGERVVTVGQPGIPPGLLLGQISAVEPVGASPVQTAYIDQLVSFYQTRVVEVWR